jgi:hypothetical protein
MQAFYTTTRREHLMAKNSRGINYSFVFLNIMNFILLNRSVVVTLPSRRKVAEYTSNYRTGRGAGVA